MCYRILIFSTFRGKIHYTEMFSLLKQIDPPLGFGNKCPDLLAYKRLDMICFAVRLNSIGSNLLSLLLKDAWQLWKYEIFEIVWCMPNTLMKSHQEEWQGMPWMVDWYSNLQGIGCTYWTLESRSTLMLYWSVTRWRKTFLHPLSSIFLYYLTVSVSTWEYQGHCSDVCWQENPVVHWHDDQFQFQYLIRVS